MEADSDSTDAQSQEVIIPVTILPRKSRPLEMNLELSFGVTCNHVRELVLECSEQIFGPRVGRRWSTLHERWRSCEHSMDPQDDILQCWLDWKGMYDEVDYVIREISTKRKQGHKKTKQNNLLVLNEVKEEVRKLHLQRLKRPLSLSQDPRTAAMQQLEKMKMYQKENRQLAKQVFRLNHQSTILSDQLSALRQGTQALSDGLSRIKNDVIKKQRDMEEELRKREERVREDVSKTRRELERQQKINELQDQKLDLAKEELLSLNTNLEEKQRELKTLKEMSDKNQVENESVECSTLLKTSQPIHEHPLLFYTHDEGDVLIHMNQESGTAVKEEDIDKSQVSMVCPSPQHRKQSLMTRHLATFSERKRKLSTEEGQTFRQGLIDDKNAEGNYKEAEKVDEPISFSYLNQEMTQNGILSSNKRVTVPTAAATVIKKVAFTPEALLLDAALVGELDLLKQCMKKVGGIGAKDTRGVTCLHNAVCSGNIKMVEYLIQQDCDINAQDFNGWTPLHYAAMYCSPLLVDLLLNNGASLFLKNSEGQTALDVAHEACTVEEDDNQNALLCIGNLSRAFSRLGRANKGMVFALFGYSASSRDELSFLEGERLFVLTRTAENEGWWFAENARKICGHVPSSYLGSHPRHQIIL